MGKRTHEAVGLAGGKDEIMPAGRGEVVKLDPSAAIVAAADVAPDRNPAAVYLAGLAAGSRRTMRAALDVMADLLSGGRADGLGLAWGQVRFSHAQALRAALAGRYRAATANKMLSALRGVLKAAWRLGYMTAEDYHHAADVGGVKGRKAEQAESGRHLELGELMALMAVCTAEGTLAGARDAAILALGYGCGLRRAELAGLVVGDFARAEHALTIRAGKGNAERVVYVENGALDALADWLEVRAAAVGGDGPLFVRIRRGDHATADGLTPQAIYDLLAKRARQAGVKPFTPHDLRRTFAGELLDAGADIVTVQKIMGHANVTTTAGYDRRGARAKRGAAKLLHVPYGGRSRHGANPA